MAQSKTVIDEAFQEILLVCTIQETLKLGIPLLKGPHFNLQESHLFLLKYLKQLKI